MILYEYPFNERIRTWLRLERLFLRFEHNMQHEHAIDHHFALVTLFELIDVASKPDLRAEIMRDLEKQKQQLSTLHNNPTIAAHILEETLTQLHTCSERLKNMHGKVGSMLFENEWITALRSRINIPGGTCEFDLPAYHAWKNQPTQQRLVNLQTWKTHISPVGDSISLLLFLLRASGKTQKMTALNGTFQQNLPQNKSFQLLRLQLNTTDNAIPEISANRLIVTIRMMQQDTNGHLSTNLQDIDFQLTLCV